MRPAGGDTPTPLPPTETRPGALSFLLEVCRTILLNDDIIASKGNDRYKKALILLCQASGYIVD